MSENETAVIVYNDTERKISVDIEIPLGISADDFIEALNEAFSWGLEKNTLHTLFLKVENPIQLIKGEKTLSEFGLRNGSVVSFNSGISENNREETENDKGPSDLLSAGRLKRQNLNRTVYPPLNRSFCIGTENDSDIIIETPDNSTVKVRMMWNGESFDLNNDSPDAQIYLNGLRIADSAEVQNEDFLLIGDCWFYFKNRSCYCEIDNGIKIHGLHHFDSIMMKNYPKFERCTRLQVVLPDEKIEILDPPAIPQKPKRNLIMRLLPSLGMIVASGVMAFFGGLMIIMSAISGAMAIFTAVYGIKEEKKEYAENCRKRTEKYHAYIARKTEEIRHERIIEKNLLETLYPSQGEEENRLFTFSPELFDRSKEDPDYLCVRLGNGDYQASREITFKKMEKYEVEDELQYIPERMAEEYKYIKNAPIVCDLKECNAIGIYGKREDRYELFKTMVIDLVARHYHTDLKMMFVAEPENKEEVWNMRFLPQLLNDRLGIRNIVCSEESKTILFEYLFSELSGRESRKTYAEDIIVFMLDESGFKSHPISKYLKNSREFGVVFVFFGDKVSDIPQGCEYVIQVSDRQSARIIKAKNKNEWREFVYSPVSGKLLETISHLLAPVYSDEVSLEKTLTKKLSFFEMLNISSVEEIDIAARWASSEAYSSLAVPVGVSKTGKVILDLHDKAHGPHGLVAGTTGSGKSEILQTYILSIATCFHPYEVSFLIIDFKGGGMVNQFKNLPHLLGAITNIDGKAISRSLRSIKAELQKRQRLFADAEVNHIDKYMIKYKNGETDTPLPHLIIIVDEFAELKAQQPDFMKELVSAARIGRSLGVHLILATQKPSGQVDEQIWSNSRFKLCLKVQSYEDSNEVIKSPLAAEIKEPGRAYLQVGNNEIFELFQSAYSGAGLNINDQKKKRFTISSLTESGKKYQIYERKSKEATDSEGSQLDATVGLINKYCADNLIEKLPDICLPMLKNRVDYYNDEKNRDEACPRFCVKIGIYDDPDDQLQGVYSIDILSNNTFILGSSQTGKTNLLQCIIREVATKYAPGEVSLYLIDFSSMVLKNFDELRHVGGVVCSSEDEKLKNLFKMLRKEMVNRRKRFLSKGVGSFAAYKESGGEDIPLIVLMIDNLTALKELYLQDNEILIELSREGLAVGISIIAANNMVSGVGYKYLSNFGTRIAFFCNDSNEYLQILDRGNVQPDNIPGRCIVEMDREIYECQTFLAFPGEKEIERVKEIRQFISDINNCYKDTYAVRIPEMPEILDMKYILENCTSNLCDYEMVVGLDYSSVDVFKADYSESAVVGVSGKDDIGMRNWLSYTMTMMKMKYPDRYSLYLIDGVAKRLETFRDLPETKAYTMFNSESLDVIKEIEKELKKRYEAYISGDDDYLLKSKLLILIIDNVDAVSFICSDLDGSEAMKSIVDKYKTLKICVITFVKNETINYADPELYKIIRDRKTLVYFDDIENMKIYDMPLDLIRKNSKALEEYDAFFINDKDVRRIKTPYC